MASSIRIFASESAAQQASSQLGEAEFSSQKALLPSQVAGQEEAAVKAAVEKGIIPPGNAAACIRYLQKGHAVVAVNAPLGRGREAIAALASVEDPNSFYLDAPPPRDPAPFSDALALPVLAKFVAATSLLPASCFTTGALPLLGGGAAVLPFPTLMDSKAGNKPVPKRNPSPFSSTFGLPTVSSPKKDWTSSLGFPMLSKNPAPLSSLLGMPVLSE